MYQCRFTFRILTAQGFLVNGNYNMLTTISSAVSPATVAPNMRLVDYIRYQQNAKGTKVMCREGGCGACIVVATVPDPTIEGGGTRSFSVQAVSYTSCQQG